MGLCRFSMFDLHFVLMVGGKSRRPNYANKTRMWCRSHIATNVIMCWSGTAPAEGTLISASAPITGCSLLTGGRDLAQWKHTGSAVSKLLQHVRSCGLSRLRALYHCWLEFALCWMKSCGWLNLAAMYLSMLSVLSASLFWNYSTALLKHLQHPADTDTKMHMKWLISYFLSQKTV